MIDRTLDKFGKLGILVNNAGYYISKNAEETIGLINYYVMIDRIFTARKYWFGLILILFLVLGLTLNLKGQDMPLGKVDFAYSPIWWQSVISLPDDKDKVLVGKEGQFLFDFVSKKDGVFRGFGLTAQIKSDKPIIWKQQKTYSAKVPFVFTIGEVDKIEICQETFIYPQENDSFPRGSIHPRRIVLIVKIKNFNDRRISRLLKLEIKSKNKITYNEYSNNVQVGHSTHFSCSESFNFIREEDNEETAAMQLKIILEPLDSSTYVYIIDRNQEKPAPSPGVEEAKKMQDQTVRWWNTQSGLPYEKVKVPDDGIQAMYESCVRNIWQARDIENGRIAFKVGPTVYRQLFVVDGAFLLETAAMLGHVKDARDGLEYMLSHQEEDGSFEIINRYYGVETFTKENGIMLWASVRHAMLGQDKEWLRDKWPNLRRTVEVIKELRAETKKNPNELNYGLIPGGYIDGGLDNKPPGSKPEYSNIYWNLIGLKAAIEGAIWLGEKQDAVSWQNEYDNFFDTFLKAAKRDLTKDKYGNSYLPVMMANAEDHPPAKGQWAFLHAVYPGRIFPVKDPLVENQLAMLRKTKIEGLVFDTGWMEKGLWSYFASFYGHAVLWQGNGREAAISLYDFARHASPLRVWREEQKPQGKGNEEVGDMPHNWASAEFVRLLIHLLQIDRGNELHLLEGFPIEWAQPGMVTQMNGVLTPFGDLNMKLTISKNGNDAKLKMQKLPSNTPEKIVLHMKGLSGEKKTRELPVDKNIKITIPLKKPNN